jgi:hypothetical protein
MRNRFPGHCMDGCGTHVAAGAGYPHRDKGRWFVRCIACVAKGKVARGDELTIPQAQALQQSAEASK